MIADRFQLRQCFGSLIALVLLWPTAAEANYYNLTQGNYRRHAPFHERIDISKIDYRRLQAAIFFVTNSQRLQHRLRPVSFHRLLERAAKGHAQRMATQQFYSHSDPDPRLRSPSKRARRMGIINPKIAEH